MSSYIIKYGMYLKNGFYESKTIRIKNCDSDIHAKVKLERYLIKHNPTFQTLVVFECEEDFIFDTFGFDFRKIF